MRPIQSTDGHCVICDEPMLIRSATSPSPEAPQMIQVRHRGCPWIGFVRPEDEDGVTEVIFACSEACMQKLLQE